MDQERVSDRAYSLWEEAGQPDGAHDHHWEQARREIEAEDAANTTDATSAAEVSPSSSTHQPAAAEDEERSPHAEPAEQAETLTGSAGPR